MEGSLIMTYDDYLKSKHWKRVRRRAVKRAGNRCQLCNGVFDLNVHHNNYDRLGKERKPDVVVLCRQCHERFHNILPLVVGNIPPIGDLNNLKRWLHIS